MVIQPSLSHSYANHSCNTTHSRPLSFNRFPLFSFYMITSLPMLRLLLLLRLIFILIVNCVHMGFILGFSILQAYSVLVATNHFKLRFLCLTPSNKPEPKGLPIPPLSLGQQPKSTPTVIKSHGAQVALGLRVLEPTYDLYCFPFNGEQVYEISEIHY